MLAETFIILTVMFIAALWDLRWLLPFLGYAVIKALSRNPSAASKIFMGMAVMLVFVEVDIHCCALFGYFSIVP